MPNNNPVTEADLFAEKGLQKYKQKKYNTAIELFTQAIKINPNESIYYRYRCWAENKLGDLIAVLRDQDKEISFDKLNPDCFIRRAYTKIKMNDLSGAIDDYSNALEIEPFNSYYYHYRAGIKIKLRDFSGAISDYTKIIELNEISRTGYFMRGKIKYEIGDKTYCEDWKEASKLGDAIASKLLEKHCSNIK